ncbi:unnamed protein product [Clavelina lepadiformis]|uniref:Ubiquitin-like domain-containing protein n=1 Tax=Clavelina lepadiformis TaxID=159417 RepID=A0ABP0FMG4_CLALP
MFVTVKTLQQQIFKVSVESTDTVKKLKEVIENERGKDDFPVEGQKLIYAGKILEDAKTISEYKIEESKFVVAMVAKPKAPLASPVASPSEETTATSSSPTPKPSTEEAEKPKADSETPSSGGQVEETTSSAPSSDATTTTTTTAPASTLATSESALGDWVRFQHQLIESFDHVIDGDFVLPELNSPPLPECDPPLEFPPLGELVEGIFDGPMIGSDTPGPHPPREDNFVSSNDGMPLEGSSDHFSNAPMTSLSDDVNSGNFPSMTGVCRGVWWEYRGHQS